MGKYCSRLPQQDFSVYIIYYLTMQALFKSKNAYVTSLLHFTLEHELLGSKAALFDVLLILVRSGLKKSS